jgi:hypothetical protein
MNNTIDARAKRPELRDCTPIDRPKKQVYEKPLLKQLSLFADEVMGNCNQPVPYGNCSSFPHS